MLLAPNNIIVGFDCSHCNMLVLVVSIFVFGVVAVFVVRRLFVVTVDRVFCFSRKMLRSQGSIFKLSRESDRWYPV